MKISRTFLIQNIILSSSMLDELAATISRHYQPTEKDSWHNIYKLVIKSNPLTTTTRDSPPKTFSGLFSDRVAGLSLEFSVARSHQISAELRHGSDSFNNQITISSNDEDWVQSRYNEIHRFFDNCDEQSTFVKRFSIFITLASTFFIGWPASKFLYSLIENKNLQEGFNYSLSYHNIMMSFMLGLPLSICLVTYAEKNFPSVELQTGPPKLWIEKNRRRQLLFLTSTLLVTPFLEKVVKLIYSFF